MGVQVNMLGTFKDDRYLYIVMEYVVGGEFFTVLRRVRRFENDAARFYAAQVTTIFEYLHGRSIIYRSGSSSPSILCSLFWANIFCQVIICSNQMISRVFCGCSLGISSRKTCLLMPMDISS